MAGQNSSGGVVVSAPVPVPSFLSGFANLPSAISAQEELQLNQAWDSVYDWYNRPMVLHYDPRGCELPNKLLDELTGVYYPQQHASCSFLIYQQNIEVTSGLAKSFSKLKGRSELMNRGIFLNPSSASSKGGLCFFAKGTWQITVARVDSTGAITKEKLRRIKSLPPDLSEYSEKMRNDKESLLQFLEIGLEDWIYDPTARKDAIVRMAFTPLCIFGQAVNLVNFTELDTDKGLTLPKHPYCRNPVALVLHTMPLGRNNRSRAPLGWLGTFLGVYVPRIVHVNEDGASSQIAWYRDLPSTVQLATIMNKGQAMQNCLESHGVSLDPNENVDIDYCLHFDLEEQRFYVRPEEEMFAAQLPPTLVSGQPLPDDVMCDLLIQEDALFRHGEKVFTNWQGYLRGDGWLEIPIALSPLKCFERAIQLASLEADLAEDIDRKEPPTSLLEQEHKGSKGQRAAARSRNKSKGRQKYKRRGGKKEDVDEHVKVQLSTACAEREDSPPTVTGTEDTLSAENEGITGSPDERSEEGRLKEALAAKKEEDRALMQSRINSACEWLLLELNNETSLVNTFPPESRDLIPADSDPSVDTMVRKLLDTEVEGELLWLQAPESVTSSLFEAILQQVDDGNEENGRDFLIKIYCMKAQESGSACIPRKSSSIAVAQTG
jgi:hypothetical protein